MWARHPYSSTVSGTFLQALFEAAAQDGAGNPGGTQEQVLAPQTVVPVPQLLPTLAAMGTVATPRSTGGGYSENRDAARHTGIMRPPFPR